MPEVTLKNDTQVNHIATNTEISKNNMYGFSSFSSITLRCPDISHYSYKRRKIYGKFEVNENEIVSFE